MISLLLIPYVLPVDGHERVPDANHAGEDALRSHRRDARGPFPRRRVGEEYPELSGGSDDFDEGGSGGRAGAEGRGPFARRSVDLPALRALLLLVGVPLCCLAASANCASTRNKSLATLWHSLDMLEIAEAERLER